MKVLADRQKFFYNKTIKTAAKRSAGCALVLLCAILLCAALVRMLSAHDGRVVPASASMPRPTLVIDAGHGGIDGGAISADGTKESDLNLAVALRLESIVRLCGQNTHMTRLDDHRKTDMISYSERDDLKDRALIVNETARPVLISIHQNDYPTEQPHGAQVLYSAYAGSEKLGKLIQSNLVSMLDPGNRRLAIPSPGELYLMVNTRCPAVLVECGFMSNSLEVSKLKDARYQTALAVVIGASYCSYVNDIQL